MPDPKQYMNGSAREGSALLLKAGSMNTKNKRATGFVELRTFGNAFLNWINQ